MDRKCPIYRVAGFLGKQWTLLILIELYKGKPKWKRFTRLKEKVPGITPKILSARLKELVRQGMVKKRVDAKTFPVKSRYSLTECGEDFIAVIKKMRSWALKWKVKNEYCETVNCRYCKM